MNANAAWIRVLRVPWQRRRNQGSMWPWALIAAMLMAMTLGPGIVIRRYPFDAALAVLLGLVALIGWFVLVVSLLQQNEPHAARLVPGHLRILRSVWLAGWVSVTLLAGAVGTHFGVGLAAALAAASSTLFICWMARWPWLGMTVWFVSALLSRIAASPPGEAIGEALANVWREAPLATGSLVAAAVVASAAVTALTILQSGNARHVRSYRRRNALQAVMKRGARWPGRVLNGRSPGMLGRMVGWPYRAWLAGVSNRRHAPRGSVLSRALVGLGPGLHWTGLASTAIVFAAWIGVCGLFASWLYPSLHRSSMPAVFWAMAALIGWLASTTGQITGVIYRTRREQPLLMLLPGMPHGSALNRPLAQRLMSQFLLAWGVSVLLVIALLGPRDAHLGWFVTFAAACLWPMARLCCDWSRTPAPGIPTALLLVFLPIGLALLAVGLETWQAIPVAVCAGALAAGAIGLTAWRYRLAVRAPTAFPAARLR